MEAQGRSEVGTCLGRKSMNPEELISAIERRKRRRKEDVEERLLTQEDIIVELEHPRGKYHTSVDISIAKDEKVSVSY